MNPKFKIGDKIKITEYGYIFILEEPSKEHDNKIYYYYNEDWWSEKELELVESTEQQAVNKKLEELKEQIEHILQYEMDVYFPSSNDFKNCIEKILKLLEKD